MRHFILIILLFVIQILQAGNLDEFNFSSISNSLKFRSIGPALTSGRIVDIAVHPENSAIYYVASAAGGVWKTTNNGVSFTSLFDGQGSYSIGCITIDPNNPNVIWVGSGENNNQRSVAYGDGLYKSIDGGQSWENVGLKNSEHIGMIKIDPRNSDRVLVAAYGPLWSEGGDRGLYESLDGGKSWNKILEVSEHTGFNEIHFDRSNPDVLYAAAHQRRRHVFTYVSGGPESALYKSVDGGKSWNKIHNGFPSGDKGRIGFAQSYQDPNTLYAIVDANEGGFYKSTDRGASWKKMSGKKTSGNYYQEIFCDPVQYDKVFVMDSYGVYTTDGGKSWIRYGNGNKHVDDHCIWIDPKNNDHYIIGSDGGLYETYGNGDLWSFKANLPVTQFYKVALDNAKPFYNVYGGTQDNFSLGGPHQTNHLTGILNQHWWITKGGDGFESQVDPSDPNTVYAQSQYGWLARYNKETGEKVNIRPKENNGEKAFRWNWDAPLLISPHNPSRLYFAANVVFKSDNRGDSWEVISPDLSQQIDRNKLPVMGKVWSMDAVEKNKSTSIYGNIVSLTESPLKEGLLYAGTDDGLIHVSQDGGKSWTKLSKFKGVPENTYVNALIASQHDVNKIFAVFNNHKNGDFKPYVYVSEDAGKTWMAIQSDLPERGSAYCLVEDHKDKNLLFVGTEFGVFVSLDAGGAWNQLKSGLPTVAVRDMEIQKEENDLVLATFGRGFYVLDNYSVLRSIKEDVLEKDYHVFDIATSKVYIVSNPLGKNGKGFQGDALYAADNAPVGAIFEIYAKDKLKTLKQIRQDKEWDEDNFYPSMEEIKAEDRYSAPYYLVEVKNSSDKVVRRMKVVPFKGMKRVVWNYRYTSSNPVSLNENEKTSGGRLASPGQYTMTMYSVINGEVNKVTEAKQFTIEPLFERYTKEQYAEMDQFFDKIEEMEKVLYSTGEKIDQYLDQIKYMEVAVKNAKDADLNWLTEIKSHKNQLKDLKVLMNGDPSLKKRDFETPASISTRIGMISWGFYLNYQLPTKSHYKDYEITKTEIESIIEKLKDISKKLKELQSKLKKAGAPYSPSSVLEFKD